MRERLLRLQAQVRVLETQNAALRRSVGRQVVAEASAMADGGDSPRSQRLSRFAGAIDAIGCKLVFGRTLEQMYREMCAACVDAGGFSLAWLGAVDAQTGSLKPLAAAGPGQAYIDGLAVQGALAAATGNEPGALAFREQRLYVCNDIAALPRSAAWHEPALDAGLRSVLALPVYRGGRAYAALMAFGPERNFIDAETVRLFEKIADSLELALDEFDLKEQQRANSEKLRQSEERFRALVENLPLKIFVKDADSRYLSCNGLFARDLGIEAEQIVGKSDFDFYPTQQAERFRREDLAIIAGGEGMDLHENTEQDGIEKIVHVIKTPFKNASGEIVGVLGAILDITERKQAELKLRHFAYEVEDIYQNAPCGYHSIDGDGKFLRINNTELNWLGYKREDLVGRLRLSDLLSEASRQVFEEVFPAFKRTGTLQDLELEMVRKDGCILPVTMSATAIYDDDGNFVSSRTMVSDISVRRELEREQRIQARRLGELSHRLVAVQEEERRRLAGELHDRANPNLVAIQLTLSNLVGKLPDGLVEENREYLDDISALLEDTTAAIREICTELRPPLLDYSGLVPTLEAYAQQISRRTGVAVDVAARLDGSPLGGNVESLLFRIVQEAVANCVKHSFAKHIHISLSGGDRNTVLTIRDDGIGFTPQLLGSGGGSAPGLGLITMRERAEFAGGRLAIHSQPGGGTEIKVEFDSLERRANLSRRHTDPLHVGRAAAREALASVSRQYAAGISERRTGACRRRPASEGNPRSAEPGFVERRSGVSRRRQEQIAPGLASQLRFS